MVRLMPASFVPWSFEEVELFRHKFLSPLVCISGFPIFGRVMLIAPLFPSDGSTSKLFRSNGVAVEVFEKVEGVMAVGAPKVCLGCRWNNFGAVGTWTLKEFWGFKSS